MRIQVYIAGERSRSHSHLVTTKILVTNKFVCVCVRMPDLSCLWMDFQKKFYLKANQNEEGTPLHFFKIRYWVRSVTKNERSEIRVAEHSFFEKGGFQVVSVFFFSVRDVTREYFSEQVDPGLIWKEI